MSEPLELPKLPEDRFEPLERKAGELKPGEQGVLNTILNLIADEDGHLWVDASSNVADFPVAPGLGLRAERTDAGFILWLDKEVKFRRRRRYMGKTYLPVVEIREASGEER